MAENGMRNVNNASASSEISNGHHHNNNNDGKTMANGIDQKGSPRMTEAAQKYVADLLAERSQMDSHFPLAIKLIDDALDRVKISGRIPTRDQYADVYQQRTIKLSQKVHVPIKDKKFNYVGKLLGPKGNSLRRLQDDTQCKIVILGRFSMKDRNREEELRNSADAKYSHLNLPLHVEVSTVAPPAEAYARMAYALAQIRRYLIPDKHDDIRQEQFRELMSDPEAAKKLTVRNQVSSNHNSGGGHGGQGGGNHYRGGNSGGYRGPKYHQQDHHHNLNEGPVYYRAQHNNANYHQAKNYVAGQRNHVQALIPAHVVGAAPASLIMAAPAAYNRNHVVNSHGGPNGGAGGSGASGGGSSNQRYRSNGQYQYNKNANGLF